LARSQPNQKWKTRTLLTVDQETGAVSPGVAVYCPVRHRVGAHTSVFQEAARAVALDREITQTALRVLKLLEAVLDYENAIRVVQKDMATELGIDAAQVNRAMKLLLKKGIIEKIEAPSLKPVYRLNPNYGWRGKHAKWTQARSNASPLKLLPGGKDASGKIVERSSDRPSEASVEAILRLAGVPTMFDVDKDATT